MLYKGANIIVFNYDVTERSSFDSIKPFIDEAKATLGSLPVGLLLVANKCDLARKVSTQGEDMALANGAMYFENSCKTGSKDAFIEKLQEVVDKIAFTSKQ